MNEHFQQAQNQPRCRCDYPDGIRENGTIRCCYCGYHILPAPTIRIIERRLIAVAVRGTDDYEVQS